MSGEPGSRPAVHLGDGNGEDKVVLVYLDDLERDRVKLSRHRSIPEGVSDHPGRAGAPKVIQGPARATLMQPGDTVGKHSGS